MCHARHGILALHSSYVSGALLTTILTYRQPKLTLLEHGNFCTGVKGHFPGLGMDVAKPLRALQFAAHSFDASITEILTPLMVGGTVCIPDESTRLNDIAKAMNDMQVTYAQLTPTFVRFLEPSMVPNLITIVLMGESVRIAMTCNAPHLQNSMACLRGITNSTPYR